MLNLFHFLGRRSRVCSLFYDIMFEFIFLCQIELEHTDQIIKSIKMNLFTDYQSVLIVLKDIGALTQKHRLYIYS